MATLEQLPFDNTYARLGPEFGARVDPSPLPGSHLVSVNPEALALLGLDAAEARRPELVQAASGERLLAGMEPFAQVYAGHQFGVYVPRLGDGRAVLLGEVRGADGRRWDLHLKGGGPTPYSRMGDGRAVLRSTLREYLASEAMHALGVPTTRALCMVGTRGRVYREDEEWGAMLVRVAPSHVRFGTFEYFHHTGRDAALRRLLDHVLEHHLPHLAGQDDAPLAFFSEVVRRTARLVARWQAVGFTHGVMNTDNMSVLGLTLDYGPYGFQDAFDPQHDPNHSDERGRYAAGQQPRIGMWNLACLGEALSGLTRVDRLQEALDGYVAAFEAEYLARMGEKLGLAEPRESDRELAAGLLGHLAEDGVDWPGFWRRLADFDTERHGELRALFTTPERFDAWADAYRQRLAEDPTPADVRRARMNRVNPRYVLRTWVAEEAIQKAEQGDHAHVDALLGVLQAPFDEHPEHERLAAPPPAWARHLALSCSS